LYYKYFLNEGFLFSGGLMIYHLSLILAMVIVGSTVTVGKVVATSMPEYITLCVRFFFGALFLFIFMKLGRYREIPIRGKSLLFLIIQAINICMFNVLLIAGLKSVSAVDSGIISGTLPVLVLLLSVILLGENVTLLKMFAVVFATAGVVVINVSGSTGEIGNSSLTGSFLILLAFVFEALFLLMLKKFTADIPTLQLSTYIAFLAFLFFLPFCVYELAQGRLAEIDAMGYWLIGYYGVFVTAVAYILWFTGIAKVSGVYASVYTAIVPVSAVVLSSIFLGEKIYLFQVYGFCLVLSAIGLLILQNIRK